MKKVAVVLLVLAAVVGTVPFWGGCDLNAKRCSTWCSIRHFNSDMKAAGCRARCALENARCQGDEAAAGVGEFMDGLKGR